MKQLTLKKETNFKGEIWYAIYDGDTYVAGSFDYLKISEWYEEGVKNPDFFTPKTEILKSEDSSLSS